LYLIALFFPGLIVYWLLRCFILVVCLLVVVACLLDVALCFDVWLVCVDLLVYCLCLVVSFVYVLWCLFLFLVLVCLVLIYGCFVIVMLVDWIDYYCNSVVDMYSCWYIICCVFVLPCLFDVRLVMLFVSWLFIVCFWLLGGTVWVVLRCLFCVCFVMFVWYVCWSVV